MIPPHPCYFLLKNHTFNLLSLCNDRFTGENLFLSDSHTHCDRFRFFSSKKVRQIAPQMPLRYHKDLIHILFI